MSDTIPVDQPTILIIEDHDLVRAALHDLVDTRFVHCRFLEAKNCEEALTLAAEFVPDVVLIDIGWPQMTDIETTRQIKAIAPHAQVALLTLYDDLLYRSEATAAGVNVFVSRHQIASELIQLLTGLPSMSIRTAPIKAPETPKAVGDDHQDSNAPLGE
jgi:DNA-binding NarL/FixJ family response regulator